MKKRIISLVLSIVLLFSMLPFNVFAEESDIMSSIVSQIEEQTGNDITVEIKKDDEQQPEVTEEIPKFSEISENPKEDPDEPDIIPSEETPEKETVPEIKEEESPEIENNKKAGEGDPDIPVESISFDITEKEIYVGESFTITATVLPEDATNKTITWTSSDASVATVSEGTVTAVSKGTVTITATSSDGDVSAVCNVTIAEQEQTNNIEWQITDGVLTI